MKRLTLNAIIATAAVTGLCASFYLRSEQKPYSLYVAGGEMVAAYVICRNSLRR